MAKKQAASDTERVEENKQKFGAAGLAKLAQQLADAQKQNSTPVPPQVVRSFKIPDFTKIAWLKCETAQARGLGVSFRGRVQQYVDQDPATPPVFIQFDRESRLYLAWRARASLNPQR